LLIERNWGSKVQCHKYFIHIWRRCSKVKAGLPSKVEFSWSTGDLLFEMCKRWMATQCHKLIFAFHFRYLNWRKNKKLRLNSWDKNKRATRLRKNFKMRSKELKPKRCNYMWHFIFSELNSHSMFGFELNWSFLPLNANLSWFYKALNVASLWPCGDTAEPVIS
jgi:hypothetical protein